MQWFVLIQWTCTASWQPQAASRKLSCSKPEGFPTPQVVAPVRAVAAIMIADSISVVLCGWFGWQ
jgi:hypothetical protein